MFIYTKTESIKMTSLSRLFNNAFNYYDNMSLNNKINIE